jgi:hypothetical protein
MLSHFMHRDYPHSEYIVPFRLPPLLGYRFRHGVCRWLVSIRRKILHCGWLFWIAACCCLLQYCNYIIVCTVICRCSNFESVQNYIIIANCINPTHCWDAQQSSPIIYNVLTSGLWIHMGGTSSPEQYFIRPWSYIICPAPIWVHRRSTILFITVYLWTRGLRNLQPLQPPSNSWAHWHHTHQRWFWKPIHVKKSEKPMSTQTWHSH